MRNFFFWISVLGAMPALAEEIPGSTIISGNWSGAAYTQESTGQFSHCAIQADYRSGDTLLFAVNRMGFVTVGVVNRAARMTIGETFPVSLTVDNRRQFHGTATAVRTDMASLDILDLDTALNALRRGYTLRVRASGYEQDFNLTGTFRALEDVVRCAVYYDAKYSPPPREEAISPTFRDKTLLFQIATAMISEAGAHDFQYLSEVDLNNIGMPDAVIWHSDELGLFSGVAAKEINPQMDLRAESALAIQELVEDCLGDAASSSRDVAWGDFPAREVRVVCRATTGITEAYRNQMLIGDLLIETLTVFDNVPAGSENNSADRQALNEAVSLQAASFAANFPR